MSGCIESKDWDPDSNGGEDKTSLDFCRTGISPGWFLSPPAMWWFSQAHVHLWHLFPAMSPFLPSRAESRFPCGCPPTTPTPFAWPQTLLLSCQLMEASGIKREQGGWGGGGSNSLSPTSASRLPSKFRPFNPPFSLENQEGGIGAMSEINILVWVQACQ